MFAPLGGYGGEGGGKREEGLSFNIYLLYVRRRHFFKSVS